MGLDIFSNLSNSDILENRRLFYSQISLKNIPIKRTLSENNKPKLLKQDYFNNLENYEKTYINPSLSYPVSTYQQTKTKNILNNKKDIEVNNEELNPSKELPNKKSFIKLKKETIKNNTIFIFDWDDTLFFTSHLEPSKNRSLNNESLKIKKMKKVIEYYVEEILTKSLNRGIVLIITNSSEGWVEYCIYRYYTNLIPLLPKINIISARSLYEKEYPAEPLTWKIKAFNDLRDKFNFEKCLLTNIICLGDDYSEIIAAQKFGENFDNCLIKTIKLREKPDLKELIKQLVLINEKILRVYSYPKSLTIKVNKKKNTKK